MVRSSLILLLAVYLLILLKFIVFKYPVDLSDIDVLLSLNNGNYLPFKTIFGYLSGEPTWHIAIRNLLGNILLFVPFGVLLPLIFHTLTWRRVLIFALILSLPLEISQVFFIGTPDIDDVLLNTLGALASFALFMQVKELFKRRTDL